MNKYAAYGLIFESEFDLSPLASLDTNKTADVSIKRASVSEDGLSGPRVTRALAQVADNVVWFSIPNIGRFQISRGCEILLDPDAQADEQTLGLYLLGSGMGAILHQRGHLVLHANAIRVGESVVLFAGRSGAGKSTTAAAFHQKGFEVISDDVVALDEQGFVVGGFPQIKLWEDALEKLDIPADDLEPIRLKVNKYSFPIADSYTERRFPVSAIYILSANPETDPDHFDFKPLEGMQKFQTLKQHTYRRHFMEGLGLRQAHLKYCSQLAAKCHMGFIIRPRAEFNAPELADYVLDDLQQAGIYSSD